jgi:hypothetical protein
MKRSPSASWWEAPVIIVAVDPSHAAPYKRGVHQGAQEPMFTVSTQCPTQNPRRTNPVRCWSEGNRSLRRRPTPTVRLHSERTRRSCRCHPHPLKVNPNSPLVSRLGRRSTLVLVVLRVRIRSSSLGFWFNPVQVNHPLDLVSSWCLRLSLVPKPG